MRFLTLVFLTVTIVFAAGCSSGSQAIGILTGHVAIGPLQPIERVGEPQPTPSPAIYAAWKIVVFSADGRNEIVRADIDSGGDYQMSIHAGKYIVTAQPVNGGVLGGQQVQPVEIFKGETTKLDVSIDTGIR
jgi:hypothetical protein